MNGQSPVMISDAILTARCGWPTNRTETEICYLVNRPFIVQLAPNVVKFYQMFTPPTSLPALFAPIMYVSLSKCPLATEIRRDFWSSFFQWWNLFSWMMFFWNVGNIFYRLNILIKWLSNLKQIFLIVRGVHRSNFEWISDFKISKGVKDFKRFQ